jgi:hypothetical protein
MSDTEPQSNASEADEPEPSGGSAALGFLLRPFFVFGVAILFVLGLVWRCA